MLKHPKEDDTRTHNHGGTVHIMHTSLNGDIFMAVNCQQFHFSFLPHSLLSAYTWTFGLLFLDHWSGLTLFSFRTCLASAIWPSKHPFTAALLLIGLNIIKEKTSIMVLLCHMIYNVTLRWCFDRCESQSHVPTTMGLHATHIKWNRAHNLMVED